MTPAAAPLNTESVHGLWLCREDARTWPPGMHGQQCRVLSSILPLAHLVVFGQTCGSACVAVVCAQGGDLLFCYVAGHHQLLAWPTY